MERRCLPQDLIEEILSRVPARSLARLRSTSKRWNSLLKSERFAKIHSAKSPKESLVVMLMDSKVYVVSVNNNLHEIHNYNVASSVKLVTQLYLNKDPFSNSSQVNIRSIFHCDGLLLCSTMDNRLVVWNPCSGETKWIKPRNRYESLDIYALGYDNESSCKKYKILRMDSSAPINVEYEIYDFTTDSWGVLGETSEWDFLPSYSGVSLKGNTYSIAFHSGASYEGFLLSFDFSKEGIRKLPLPHHQYPFSHKVLSAAREDQLCFCATSSTNLDVWVTPISTGSVVSWSNPLNVNASHKRDYDFSSRVSLLANEQNKLVLCCNRYIHGDSHSENVCSHLLNYVPSLVPIQQATCDL